MEAQDGAHVALGLVHDLLVVGLHQQRQGHAVRSQRRLDDVGNIVLVLLLVVVGQILSGELLVLAQVVVRPVRHAPQFAPAEGEAVLEVRGGLGVEGQFLRRVVPQTEVLLPDTQAREPVVAEGPPVLEPLQIRAGLAEEFQLHLFKLPDAEDEVPRGNLVAEGLAHLAHAEGQFPPGGALDGREVHKDALGRLRAEIDFVGRVLRDALVGLEHEVEAADVGEVALPASGTGNLFLPDEGNQFLLAHGLHGDIQALLPHIVLHQLVGPVAHFAGLAVDEGVVEGGDVAGGHPHLGIHENGGVQAHVVGALLDEFLPPGPLHVVFQLHAQRTVIPAVGQAAVNLAAREHEAPALAQGHQLLHALVLIVHVCLLLLSSPGGARNAGYGKTAPAGRFSGKTMLLHPIWMVYMITRGPFLVKARCREARDKRP